MSLRAKLYNTIYEKVCDEADAVDWGDQTYEDKVEWIRQETHRRQLKAYDKPDTPDIDSIAETNYENRRT